MTATSQPYNPGSDAYLVGAFWYPWYGVERRHWNEGYLGKPTLGEYDSSNPQVIDQQIAWGAAYGVDFFAASWWGRDSYEDRTIRQFLLATRAQEMRFAILYESTGQLTMQNGFFDMSNVANRQALASDMSYLAEQYFRQPNYLTIEDRPVVFIYLTRIFSGDVRGALEQARQAVRQVTGQEIFIIGDEVYWQPPTQDRLSLFDGVTAYNMHTSTPFIAQRFAQKVDAQYRDWAQAAQKAGVAFAPDVLPGFDDTAVRPEAGHPVIPRSPESFSAQLATALELASPPARMVMITSWNEWHEYTSIEPAEEFGVTYLELLREALSGKH